MKRTFSSRFVAVGTIDEKDPIVDKRPTWGAVYGDLVAAELRGEPAIIYDCPACDISISVDDKSDASWMRLRHKRSRRHQRLARAAS